MTRTQAFNMITGMGVDVYDARKMLHHADTLKGETVKWQTHKGVFHIKLTKKSYSVKVKQ